MAEDWARAEAEATVADYFDMLDHEVRARTARDATPYRVAPPGRV